MLDPFKRPPGHATQEEKTVSFDTKQATLARLNLTQF
jgi:hypothetical protein